MKYVDWVQEVLRVTAEETAANSDTRLLGVAIARVADLLGFRELASSPEFHESAERAAILDAVEDLRRMGLADGDDPWHVRLTHQGRKGRTASLRSAWPTISEIDLDNEQLEFLTATSELSERPDTSFARTDWVTAEAVFAALGWDYFDLSRAYDLSAQLSSLGCIVEQPFLGGTIHVAATYVGIVRATEAEETELRAFVRSLIPDWETTTVEFKLTVDLHSPTGKGEFVHDLLALATTKASGRCVMILGFDPATHEFRQTVDPTLTQDRIEQILNAYAEPFPGCKYRTVQWDSGRVGLIEVFRDPSRIPYRFKRAIGRYVRGEVFVRHGSQVEPPTSAELTALEEEGRIAGTRAA